MADEKVLGNEQKKDAPKTETKGVALGPAKTPREALEQERTLHPVVPVAAHLPTDFDTPFREPEVPTTPVNKAKAERDKKTAADKAELVKKVGEILEKYDHRESDIPPGHEYWGLVANLRTLG